jgi:hypothetical protein
MYLMFFPIFTLVVLFMLPMVKALFVLTSMLFTMAIFGIRKTFFKVPPPRG